MVCETNFSGNQNLLSIVIVVPKDYDKKILKLYSKPN